MNEYGYKNIRCLILDDVPEHIRTAKNTLFELGMEYVNLYPADNQIEQLSQFLKEDTKTLNKIYENLVSLISEQKINLIFLDMNWNRHSHVETIGQTSGEHFMTYLSNRNKFGQIPIIAFSVFPKSDIETTMPMFHIQKNLGGIDLDKDVLKEDIESNIVVANVFKLVRNYDTIVKYELKMDVVKNFHRTTIEEKNQIIGFVCEKVLPSDLIEFKKLLQNSNDYSTLDKELKEIIDGAGKIVEEINKEEIKNFFFKFFEHIAPYNGVIQTSISFLTKVDG